MSLANAVHTIEMGPSDHLTWKELGCKDGTDYPTRFISDGRVFRLAQMFENIRAMYGMPIRILSAYRTPQYNRSIGGAKDSQHTHGRALDLKPPKGIHIDRFYQDIVNNHLEFGITGIGKYKTFVHVDIRPGHRTAFWSGNGLKDSRT